MTGKLIEIQSNWQCSITAFGKCWRLLTILIWCPCCPLHTSTSKNLFVHEMVEIEFNYETAFLVRQQQLIISWTVTFFYTPLFH